MEGDSQAAMDGEKREVDNQIIELSQKDGSYVKEKRI